MTGRDSCDISIFVEQREASSVRGHGALQTSFTTACGGTRLLAEKRTFLHSMSSRTYYNRAVHMHRLDRTARWCNLRSATCFSMFSPLWPAGPVDDRPRLRADQGSNTIIFYTHQYHQGNINLPKERSPRVSRGSSNRASTSIMTVPPHSSAQRGSAVDGVDVSPAIKTTLNKHLVSSPEILQ